MSVVQVVLNTAPNYWATCPYGSNQWQPSGSNTVAVLPVGQGSVWAVWQVYVPGLTGTSSEVVNGIYWIGGADFTVPPGGAGITRNVSVFGNMFNTPSGFNGASSLVTLANIVGTGTGVNVAAGMAKAGFTLGDIKNGNMWVGISASSGAANPSNDGTVRWGALSLTISTGPDQSVPPPANNSGTLINPAANNNPGKVQGLEKFASCKFTLDTPVNQTGLTHVWDLPFGTPGLTFSDGNQQLLIQNLFSGSQSQTGLINIAGNVAPGVYALKVSCNTIKGLYQLTTTLRVKVPDSSGMLMTEV